MSLGDLLRRRRGSRRGRRRRRHGTGRRLHGARSEEQHDPETPEHLAQSTHELLLPDHRSTMTVPLVYNASSLLRDSGRVA